MERFWIRHFFGLLLLYCAISGINCRKSSSQPSFSGIYTEYVPTAGRTSLNFINSHQVTVFGYDLSGQELLSPDTLGYVLTTIQSRDWIYFISDSAGVKDSTGFYYEFTSQGGFELSTCPFGVFCFAMVNYFDFTR